jgi:transposase InsO family protein
MCNVPKQSHEPLKPITTPEIPYGEVGCHLFDFKQKKYLMILDYHFRYFEAIDLKSAKPLSVVKTMKATCSCHGIPMKLPSNNGPPFNSREFRLFCEQYGIQHTVSSLHFQSSNGEAERTIQTVKKL